MEFRSSEVMAYILNYGNSHEHPLNKTQAQKLLYCCYGAILAQFDERLTDEHPKAWPYGPVFPRTVNDINKKRLTLDMAQNFEANCPPEWLELIHKTLRTFWNYTATQLSTWSHRKGSPWSKADALNSLDDREIKNYFDPYLKIIDERGQNGNS